MGQKTGSCFQRCAGLDAINTLNAISYEMEQELGTEYHQRFLNFLRIMQDETLSVTRPLRTQRVIDPCRPVSKRTPTSIYEL